MARVGVRFSFPGVLGCSWGLGPGWDGGVESDREGERWAGLGLGLLSEWGWDGACSRCWMTNERCAQAELLRTSWQIIESQKSSSSCHSPELSTTTCSVENDTKSQDCSCRS